MTSSKVPPAASIAALRFSNTCWAWARKSSLPTTLPEGNLTGNQDDGPASYSCDLRVANRLRRGIRNDQLKIDLTGHRFSRSFVGLFFSSAHQSTTGTRFDPTARRPYSSNRFRSYRTFI